MRQRKLYDQLACFVCPDALTKAEAIALECCLRDGGATIIADLDAAASVTHIVCHPQQYARFLPQRNERFIAIVRPEWVFKTFLLQTLVSVDRFSANPALIFSSLVISAGPIDKDPRKVIDGLITHFGGQIVESERNNVGATHILSLDEPSQSTEPPHLQWFRLSYTETDVVRSVQTWKKWLVDRPASLEYALPSCVMAYLGKAAGLAEQHHVGYNWIEDCVQRKTRVPEGAFATTTSDPKAKKAPSWKTRPETQIEDIGLAPCALVYQTSKADAGGVELTLARRSSAEKTAALQATLSGAIVLLAQHIPPVLKERISDILKTAKAKVANVPLGDSYQEIVKKVVANASFVVCRYQAGFEYDEAVRQGKRVVSIYWVLAGHSTYDDKQTTFQEAISRPVKSFGGIAGMQGFVITLSGYSSRTTPTREDIQIAIHATGACMLPVLSRTHSTHLLCYEATGEKFKKSQSWRFENIVNHEWLFACLAAWEHVPEDAYRYKLPKLTESAAGDSTAASDATDESKQDATRSTASSAATPNAKLAGSGGGRFDVDDMLTELNETTPVNKASDATADASAGVAAVEGTAGASKDVACKLFDTPSTEAKTQSKVESGGKRGKKREAAAEVIVATPTGLRTSKRRSVAAKSASKEPDDEDDVDAGDSDNGADAVAEPAKTKSAAKVTRSSTASKHEASAKKSSSSLLAQASTDALEALGAAPAKKPAAAASGKRKRGQSLQDAAPDTDDSSDVVVVEPDAAEENAKPTTARGKRAKAAAQKPEKTPASTKRVTSPRAAAASTAAVTTSDDDKAAVAKPKATAAATGSRKNASDFIFLLTGSHEESAVNESIIAALGGKASQSGRKFDHSSTHIICSELKRTEKFVAGCAGGKWILKPSYLEASSAAGRFVDEAPHEWGASEGDSELMDPRIWPAAPAYWRQARADGKPGAFAGWRFLVHAKCVPPPGMCERVIEASDGIVVPLTKSLDLAATVASAQTPLLALVPADLPSRDAWLKKFVAHKIECVNASFLIDYITKDQRKRPNLADYRVAS